VANEWRKLWHIAGLDIPAFAQRLSRPSVKPIHEDGVSSLRPLPDQHKVLTQERPTASPIPSPHLGTFVGGHMATKHRQSLIPNRSCNVL